MNKFLARLKEPSTYAGLGILGTMFGVKELLVFNTPEVIALIVGAIGAVGAIVAPEGKKDEPKV